MYTEPLKELGHELYYKMEKMEQVREPRLVRRLVPTTYSMFFLLTVTVTAKFQ